MNGSFLLAGLHPVAGWLAQAFWPPSEDAVKTFNSERMMPEAQANVLIEQNTSNVGAAPSSTSSDAFPLSAEKTSLWGNSDEADVRLMVDALPNERVRLVINDKIRENPSLTDFSDVGAHVVN